MIEQLRSNTKTIKTENIEVVYNLIFKNALYSLECYKEGVNKENTNNYCLLEDMTDDEGEAEAFLHRMARGKVFPVHIKDIAEDYFQD
ncbi:MAG: hypothetical protein K0S01_907 [Herbinix sp.]|jgi:hypothetical protein|nr:hypothetical protein [Herbinix sp.]